MTIEIVSIKEIEAAKHHTNDYMKVEVHLAKSGYCRSVYVPREIANDVPNFLSNVFKFGQNDFQPSEEDCSVSVLAVPAG